MRTVALAFGLLLLTGLPSGSARAQDSADSTYTVQAGDTLYSIAREVGVSVRTLMRWNDLDDTALQVGQTLRIRPPASAEPESPRPDTAAAPDTTGTGEEGPPPYGRHTVQAGDTFVDLALRLGTTADSLFVLNDSTTAPLSPDRTLRLPRRFGPPTHVVRPGETLYGVAGEYGVSARALRMENELDADTLRAGRRLRIPGRERTQVPPPGEWAPPDSTGRVAVYPSAFAGRLTASGTPYAPGDFVVSHPSLPFDSVVLLSSRDPARQTFARVIDRGPVEEGVLLDVSAAVAEQLGLDGDETPSVALRVVWRADGAD